MKSAIVLIVLLFITPEVHSNAESNLHEHQTVEEIGALKQRVKALRNLIDSVNGNFWQSGTTATVQCDVFDKFRNSVKCITSAGTSPIIKRTTLKFARKFSTAPLISVGITGMSFIFGADVELSAQDVQKNDFLLQVKSDDLIAPLSVNTAYFGSPAKEHVHQ